jgi:hypothetical protein
LISLPIRLTHAAGLLDLGDLGVKRSTLPDAWLSGYSLNVCALIRMEPGRSTLSPAFERVYVAKV